MSRRVLLVNFLIMVALSLVAAGLVAFPPPKPPVPEALLPQYRADDVISLQVRRRLNDVAAPSIQETVSREGSSAWLCSWPLPDGTLAMWPASDARVRAALRMLAEATLTPLPASTEFAPTASLGILSQQAPKFMVFFGQTSVAGRAQVSANTAAGDRPGLTDDRLHSVFASSGLLPWRDDRAMPGVARDPIRLTITAPASASSTDRHTLELARVQGRWGLVAPIVERAEGGTVQTSVEGLGRMTVVSFRDDTDSERVGLSPPRVTIQVQGGRGPDFYLWQIEIGAPASADGNQVFARLTGHRGDQAAGQALGPVYVVLGLDALSGVYTNPEAYLARTSLATPLADVRRFSIQTPDGARSWRYERTLDGWQVTSPSAETARAATTAEAAAIPAMLEVLCNVPAVASGLATPAGFSPIALFEVEGASGLVAESITIGRAPVTPSAASPAPPAGTTVLTIHAGSVWRRHGEMPQAFVTLLPVGP